MNPSRWERLLDVRPISALEYLATYAAETLLDDIQSWPKPLESVSAESAAEFEGLLASTPAAPPPAVQLEAVRLAAWDLDREFDAFDDYVRNERWSAHGVQNDQRAVLLFLTRWLVEQLFSLGDATHGRMQRPHMRRCLEEMSRRLTLINPNN
jgi:hypothetical protein